MTPAEVDKMLSAYNRCLSRATHIKNQLAMMEHQLEVEKAHILASEALHGQSYDSQPHGTGPGNPVENLVLRYISGFEPKYIKDLQRDVDRAKDELFECEMVIKFVNGWMLALTEREKFIIQRHVLDHSTWRIVLDQYEKQYGQFGKEGLRKIKKKALGKIYEAAE